MQHCYTVETIEFDCPHLSEYLARYIDVLPLFAQSPLYSTGYETGQHIAPASFILVQKVHGALGPGRLNFLKREFFNYKAGATESIGDVCSSLSRLQMTIQDKEKSPNELWTGRQPDISHIRKFGCLVHVYISKSPSFNTQGYAIVMSRTKKLKLGARREARLICD